MTSLIGRETELRAITSLFSEERASRVLVLRGDPGVGKSRLLAAAVTESRVQGYQVLQSTGAESEMKLAFANLHQLLHPIFGNRGGLSPEHQAALERAMGSATGAAPPSLSLGAAVLDLLALTASRQPLLIVIDDVQWLDEPSAETFAFVVRRLADYDIVALLATRSGEGSALDQARLRELEVNPLRDDDASALLASAHPSLNESMRSRVLEEAAGNPLAIEELPRSLERGIASPDSSLAGLPLSRRLEMNFGHRLRDLPSSARAPLLRAALDGMRALDGTRHQDDIVEIGAAVDLGFLVMDRSTGHMAFKHPLVRSAVIQAATPNERRVAHAALAVVHQTDPERRAWHLGAATVDPDEAVAVALDEAARVATRRGASSAAIAALRRGAELSPRSADRSRRLAEAAFIAGQSAQLDEAANLLREAESSAGSPSEPLSSVASVISAAYLALYRNGDVAAAERLLLELSHLEGDAMDAPAMTRMLNALITVSLFSGTSEMWERTAAEVDRYGDRVSASTRLWLDTFGDLVGKGETVPERLAEGFANSSSAEPWDVMRLTVAAFYLDRLAEYRPYVRRMLDRESEAGAVGNVMTVMQVDVLDQMWSGRWEEAAETGVRGAELTRRHGYWTFYHQFLAFDGVIAAVTGEFSRAEEQLATVERWARPRGIGFLTQYCDLIGTLTALGRGDYETAFLHAVSVTEPGSFTPHLEQAPRMTLDLVEAAVHTGRPEQARSHALAARAAGFERISPRLELMTLGSLALTADDDHARAHYEAALALPLADRFPFEQQRIRLAYGTWLRRMRENRAAAAQLSRASEAFERLGARPWADRANIELRASGVDVRATRSNEDLTPQEREIAELAASGLSNKKIGEQMFLSPRTVSWHLYRIFPKLGITSRASLRDVL